MQGLHRALGPQISFRRLSRSARRWLQYTVTHWWDRWLKGKTPPPEHRLAAICRCGSGESRRRANLLAPTRRANGWPRTALAPRVKEKMLYLRGRQSPGRGARGRPTRAQASSCSTPRCWRRAPGANAAMTIFPAIRRGSTRSRSISTAIRCTRISTASAFPRSRSPSASTGRSPRWRSGSTR